jgi:hypothetical protein
MVRWYKILCAGIVMAYLITTARGYPIVNLFDHSVGAQKGASQFHK